MKKSFKIIPFITASIFCLNTSSSLSMNTDPAIESASHFSARETDIFQAEISKVKNKVFSQFYTPKKVDETGAYTNAIHFFARERKKIADLCVQDQLLDAEEAELFSLFRPEYRQLRDEPYKTPLIPGDNTFFYEQAMKTFKKGSLKIESSLGIFSRNINTVRSSQFEKHLQIIETIRNSKLTFNSQELSMMRHPLSSEVYCFRSLLATKDSVKLFVQNTELGEIIKVGSNMVAALNPTVTFSALRFTLAMDGKTINLGSISCLSLPTGSTYQYYPLFVIDHCRASHIKPLLSLAEQYWKEALNWHKIDDSTDFFHNLARVFYLQTIAVPYGRGSESNAKAQIECIARYHGEELVFSPKLAFRMPFILSPDEFTHYFQKHVYFKSELEQMID